MSIRYNVMKFNALKLIEYYYFYNPASNSPLILTTIQTKDAIMDNLEQDENALFFQILHNDYSKNDSISSFDKVRELCSDKNFDDSDEVLVKDYIDTLRKKIIFVDFSEVFTNRNHLRRKSNIKAAKHFFTNGITLSFNGESKLNFLPFIKSGSMSRASTISFIEGSIYKIVTQRITLGLINTTTKYTLSKLLAYEGLSMSSGLRIDLQDMNEKSVLVVSDYKKIDSWDPSTNFTTFISRDIVIGKFHLIIFFNQEKAYECSKAEDLLIAMFRNVNNDFYNREVVYDNQSEFYGATLPSLKMFGSIAMKKCEDGDNPYNHLSNKYQKLYDKTLNQIFRFLGIDKLRNDGDLKEIENISFEIETNMFDGEGFIDMNLAKTINRDYFEISEEPFHHSFQIRLPFTKGMLHSVDLGMWFERHNRNQIFDAFGKPRDTKDIKIILTTSMFKCYGWMKDIYTDEKNDFFSDYDDDPMKYFFSKFNEYNHALYITNKDSTTEVDNNTILNYQVLHTPYIKFNDFVTLLEKGNNEYCDIKTKPMNQLKYFLDYQDNVSENNESKYSFEIEEHNMQTSILQKNPYFIYDQIYKNRIDKYAKSLLKNMKVGRIPIEGYTRYLSGDLLHLLEKSTLLIPESSTLETEFYDPGSSYQYDENKVYTLLRNPHITAKELVQSSPVSIKDNLKRKVFFGHLNSVIMLDSYTNTMLAMQTADNDGDIVRIIHNSLFNEGVQKSLDLNRVISNKSNKKNAKNFICNFSFYFLETQKLKEKLNSSEYKTTAHLNESIRITNRGYFSKTLQKKLKSENTSCLSDLFGHDALGKLLSLFYINAPFIENMSNDYCRYKYELRSKKFFSKKLILNYQDLSGKKEIITKDNIFNNVVLTFSSRVGLISNDAFTHSIRAYNANSNNHVAKEIHRIEAEKLSYIVSAEIDSAKSGKAPYYRPPIIDNPFLRFKSAIKKGGKTSKLNLYRKPDSPNLYFLKENAENLQKKVKDIKVENKLKGKIRFVFQEDKSWRSKLNIDLKNELELLVIAYKDWNNQINYLNHKPEDDSTLLRNVRFILSLQYNDSKLNAIVENLVINLVGLGIDKLSNIRNNLVQEKWYYFTSYIEKDNFCKNNLPFQLNSSEETLLFNFNNGGHKLLYLLVTEAIDEVDKSNYTNLNELDSIARYQKIVSTIHQRYNKEKDSSGIISKVSNSIIKTNIDIEEITNSKLFLEKEVYKGDYDKIINSLHKLHKILKRIKTKKKNFELSNLRVISNHFYNLSKFLYDDNQKLTPASLYRNEAFKYCNKILLNLFKKYDVPNTEDVKYIYSLKKHDTSLNFMFSICKKNILKNVKEYPKVGDLNA